MSTGSMASCDVSPCLEELETILLGRHCDIEQWFRTQFQTYRAPITSSVDIRNAGYKIASVDNNLFPAGFNNLSSEMLPLAIQAITYAIEKELPGCKRLLIIPESHTRNTFYFESLATLKEIIECAGYQVFIGSLLPSLTGPEEFTLPSTRKITLMPLERIKDKVGVKDFSACLVIINNDFSEGIPDILQNLDQIVQPPLNLGWFRRLKSQHFTHYQQVTEDFAKLLQIDPWLLNPLFRTCHQVDFMKREGEECLSHQVDLLLQEITKKYREYRIEEKPFVVVKTDSGSYGMGVIMVNDAKQITELNRKQRTKMSTTKGNQKVDKVIIQEGVYTLETIGDNKATAEPVIYSIGQHVIGGFYRYHQQLKRDENLNSPGMEFEAIPFNKACNTPLLQNTPRCDNNRFYIYSIVARLATLTSALEMEQLEQSK